MDVQDYLDNGGQRFIKQISIDVAVLGFKHGELNILLSELNGRWALQGGHIGRNESVEDAIARITYDRSGISNPFLQLFKVFGNKDRNFKNEFKNSIINGGFKWRPEQWMNDRFITLAYFALVDIEQTEVRGSTLFPKCDWHSISNLPDMILDHKSIILDLKRHLKEEVSLFPIAHHFLPKLFTLPQLRSVHEAILERKLDRSRFQQKVLSLDIYERLPLLNKSTPGRKPYLYQYNRSRIKIDI